MSVTEAVGILFDTYREGKLLDRYLETVAIKHDLNFEDVKLLFFLSQTDESCTLTEIAEVTQIKRRKLTLSIQKLLGKELLRTKDSAELDKKRSNHKVELEILRKAEPIISDMLVAKDRYQQIKYSGLSEEEIEQYEILSERVRVNVQQALK